MSYEMKLFCSHLRRFKIPYGIIRINGSTFIYINENLYVTYVPKGFQAVGLDEIYVRIFRYGKWKTKRVEFRKFIKVLTGVRV